MVGISQVEANWYLGYIDSRQGIFPLTHVWHVDPTILKVIVFPASFKFSDGQESIYISELSRNYCSFEFFEKLFA